MKKFLMLVVAVWLIIPTITAYAITIPSFAASNTVIKLSDNSMAGGTVTLLTLAIKKASTAPVSMLNIWQQIFHLKFYGRIQMNVICWLIQATKEFIRLNKIIIL